VLFAPQRHVAAEEKRRRLLQGLDVAFGFEPARIWKIIV